MVGHFAHLDSAWPIVSKRLVGSSTVHGAAVVGFVAAAGEEVLVEGELHFVIWLGNVRPWALVSA